MQPDALCICVTSLHPGFQACFTCGFARQGGGGYGVRKGIMGMFRVNRIFLNSETRKTRLASAYGILSYSSGLSP